MLVVLALFGFGIGGAFAMAPQLEVSLTSAIAVVFYAYLLVNSLPIVGGLIHGVVRVSLTTDAVEGCNVFGRRTTIRYADIVRVTEHFSRSLEIQLWGAGDLRLRLSPTIANFGEMLECILERLENVREVSVLGMAQQRKYWQKEADMGIVREAIARAEENRKREHGRADQ